MIRFRRSLRTHLMVLYIMLAGLSGIIVPFAGTHVALSGFREYLYNRQSDELEAMGRNLVELYEENGKWDNARIWDTVRQTMRSGPASIVITDASGTRIFPLRPGRGKDPTTMMSPGPENDAHHQHDKNRHEIPLTTAGKRIGTLVLYQPPQSGRIEKLFVTQLLKNSLIGASLAILAACALGFAVANRLSRPILKAAKRARLISAGRYDMQDEVPSGIVELDRLSVSVQDLGHSLAGQEKQRKQLMVDVAHELRTPITVVKSQLEAIADGVWEPTHDRLSSCLTEVDRLSDLVSEVETLTTIEGNAIAIHPEPANLTDFLRNLADSFAPVFSRSGIKLSCELQEKVSAPLDASRCRHAMENLLSNAQRYTSAGGMVILRLKAGDGKAVIEVEDNGIGIRPQDLPHIFDRFYRADPSRARTTGGRGVGLAIARAAIEAHGGTITVTSTEGKGTIFTVTIPTVI